MAIVFLTAFGISVAIIGLLLHSQLGLRIAADIPNERSLHTAPVPRIGGWGVVPAALVAGSFSTQPDTLLICLVVVLFFMSYGDDRYSLPIVVRMPIHAVAAALWLTHGPIALSPIVAILAGCGIVWITNLFNFMDGADGLAGGMAVFAFATFGAVATAAGINDLGILSSACAGGAAGFLLFNLHPARVFLGDCGSITLGFLAGVFGIWGWAKGAWPFWFPFLVSAPFFLDATVTLLRRVVRREAFWRAHRDHYYQRLIRAGWTHRRTATCEYAVMAACCGLAIAMLEWPREGQFVGLVAATIGFLVIGWHIDRLWVGAQREERGEAVVSGGHSAHGHSHYALPARSRIAAARSRFRPRISVVQRKSGGEVIASTRRDSNARRPN